MILQFELPSNNINIHNLGNEVLMLGSFKGILRYTPRLNRAHDLQKGAGCRVLGV